MSTRKKPAHRVLAVGTERVEDPLRITYTERSVIGYAASPQPQTAREAAEALSRAVVPLQNLAADIERRARAVLGAEDDNSLIDRLLDPHRPGLVEFTPDWYAYEVILLCRSMREFAAQGDTAAALDEAIRLGALAKEADLYQSWGTYAARGKRSTRGGRDGALKRAKERHEQLRERDAAWLHHDEVLRRQEPTLKPARRVERIIEFSKKKHSDWPVSVDAVRKVLYKARQQRTR